MTNKIDLSKIKVKELPTKIVKANLDGEEREFEIRALNDKERLALSLIGDTPEKQIKIIELALHYGLGVSASDVDGILTYFADGAMYVAKEILDLTSDFVLSKESEFKEAEKN